MGRKEGRRELGVDVGCVCVRCDRRKRREEERRIFQVSFKGICHISLCLGFLQLSDSISPTSLISSVCALVSHFTLRSIQSTSHSRKGRRGQGREVRGDKVKGEEVGGRQPLLSKGEVVVMETGYATGTRRCVAKTKLCHNNHTTQTIFPYDKLPQHQSINTSGRV